MLDTKNSYRRKGITSVHFRNVAQKTDVEGKGFRVIECQERIVLHRADRKLPKSYLGPVESVRAR